MRLRSLGVVAAAGVCPTEPVAFSVVAEASKTLGCFLQKSW